MSLPHQPPDGHDPARTNDVPLTVWACAQAARPKTNEPRVAVLHTGNLRADIARRVISEFTRPGDLVLDPDCGVGVALAEAARLDRYGVGGVPDQRWAGLARAYLDRACTTRQRKRTQVITGGPDGLAGALREDQRDVDLVLTAPPIRRTASESTAHYAAWARLLRPGGLLVTVTRTSRVHGTLSKIAGTTIQLAQGTGLRYVQHIVALRVPVRDGALAVQLTRPRGHRYGRYPGEALFCRVIHDDVLVFAKPRCPRPGEAAR